MASLPQLHREDFKGLLLGNNPALSDCNVQVRGIGVGSKGLGKERVENLLKQLHFFTLLFLFKNAPATADTRPANELISAKIQTLTPRRTQPRFFLATQRLTTTSESMNRKKIYLLHATLSPYIISSKNI
jgi:hypothetical protein